MTDSWDTIRSESALMKTLERLDKHRHPSFKADAIIQTEQRENNILEYLQKIHHNCPTIYDSNHIKTLINYFEEKIMTESKTIDTIANPKDPHEPIVKKLGTIIELLEANNQSTKKCEEFLHDFLQEMLVSLQEIVNNTKD